MDTELSEELKEFYDNGKKKVEDKKTGCGKLPVQRN